MNIIHVSAIALIDTDGRVLLAQRPEGKAMAGLWEFPGGKVEPSETPEVALIREIREELGIDIHASCLAPLSFVSHAYTNAPVTALRGQQAESALSSVPFETQQQFQGNKQDTHHCPTATDFVPASQMGLTKEFHLVMYLFACRKWVGVPMPREGQNLRWVNVAQMRTLPMPPADIPLVASLSDYL